MKCVICKQAETKPGTTTLTLERGGATFVVNNVPAQVCSNCGEAYVDEETTAQVLRTAEQMARAGTQVDIRQYVTQMKLVTARRGETAAVKR
jgi:YgiT-type zinc finger domain-containing protein